MSKSCSNIQNKRSLLKRMKQYTSIYIMLIPVAVYFLLFSFYPLILGILSSLQAEKLIGTPDFVGWANYKALLTDRKFYSSLYNAVFIGGLGLILNIFVGLTLAIMINEFVFKKIKSIFQTATYLPYLFSWAVVGGIWINMLSTNGIVNSFLSLFGHQPINFFAIAAYGKPIMLITNVWKNCGYYAVLLLAGIVSIDGSVYESAQIDGASRLRQIIHIMVPALTPTIKVVIVLGSMNLLKTFDQVYAMLKPAIADEITTVLLYIYQTGFRDSNIGKATAGATIVLAITLLFTTAVRRLTKYDQSYEG